MLGCRTAPAELLGKGEGDLRRRRGARAKAMGSDGDGRGDGEDRAAAVEMVVTAGSGVVRTNTAARGRCRRYARTSVSAHVPAGTRPRRRAVTAAGGARVPTIPHAGLIPPRPPAAAATGVHRIGWPANACGRPSMAHALYKSGGGGWEPRGARRSRRAIPPCVSLPRLHTDYSSPPSARPLRHAEHAKEKRLPRPLAGSHLLTHATTTPPPAPPRRSGQTEAVQKVGGRGGRVSLAKGRPPTPQPRAAAVTRRGSGGYLSAGRCGWSDQRGRSSRRWPADRSRTVARREGVGRRSRAGEGKGE